MQHCKFSTKGVLDNNAIDDPIQLGENTNTNANSGEDSISCPTPSTNMNMFMNPIETNHIGNNAASTGHL